MFHCSACGMCCRKIGGKSLYQSLDRGDGICMYLSGNWCSIYEKRPLLCRVDDAYDVIFKGKISLEMYYAMNYEVCKRLQEGKRMAIPVILATIAAAAGAKGIYDGIRGGQKMNEANEQVKRAKNKQERAIQQFKKQNEETIEIMDSLGKLELTVLGSFDIFADLMEKIQGRPKFKLHTKEGIYLPEYESESLRDVSIGANVLLGGLGGAAVGTAGGFAAAGATTSAVMALGTASTGVAISSLSGVAATNATLAALGGGALAAGGGGMALGQLVLGGATLGVGLLVGGIIFNAVGEELLDKANEAYEQATKTEQDARKVIAYLAKLSASATIFTETLTRLQEEYNKRLQTMAFIIDFSGKREWKDFSEKEKKVTENTVLLVGLLYQMCQVKLVLQAEEADGLNEVNAKDIDCVIDNVNGVLDGLETAV